MNEPKPASEWVIRFLSGIPFNAPVLDVACGKGRHLRLARAAGHAGVGIDIDLSGVADLAKQPEIELIAANLEDGSPFLLSERRFAGVIVTSYLWRPLLPALVRCVADDGLLIYETFADGNEKYGSPGNPDHLLKPGELLAAVRSHLTPIAFEHVTLGRPKRVVQRIAAAGPKHRWLTDPPVLAAT